MTMLSGDEARLAQIEALLGKARRNERLEAERRAVEDARRAQLDAAAAIPA